MNETFQMNTAWLAELPNPHHDGTTQQISDFASAYQTDNARYLAKLAVLNQCRQTEDDVWLKAQRDVATKKLEGADDLQDAYVNAARFINKGYTFLPDSDPLKAEALEVEQIFLDYSFHVIDSYGAEADKIIQMQQNFQPHVEYLTQIGAWQWYLKAVTAAGQVRQFLGERALSMGQAVKGEMKTARKATDAAIADLYKTIEAMNELMPSAELSALITQLKGIELYARQYIIKDGSNQSGTGGGQQTTDNGQQTGSEGGQQTTDNGQQTGGDSQGQQTTDNGQQSGGDDNGGQQTGGDDNGGDNGGPIED